VQQDIEMGGFIVDNGDNTYTYTDPVTQNKSDTVNLGVQPDNSIGSYHSHGKPKPGGETYSGGDQQTQIWRSLGYGYVVTPNGYIIQSIYRNGEFYEKVIGKVCGNE